MFKVPRIVTILVTVPTALTLQHACVAARQDHLTPAAGISALVLFGVLIILGLNTSDQ